MKIGVQQLREELYHMAKRRLALEEEIKAMVPFMVALKRELDQRMPVTQ